MRERPERQLALLFLCLLLVGVACGGGSDAPETTRAAGTGQRDEGGPIKAIDVDIRELEDSGVTGVAKLSTVGPEDGKMVIELEGAPDGPLALHTHSGPCTVEPTQPSHELDPVVNGRVEALISASVQGLTHGGFNISIHANEDGESDHIACSEITTLARVEDE